MQKQILIRLNLPDGYRIDAVAIGGRVYGVDGAGISVVRHPRDLAQLRFVEAGVFRLSDVPFTFTDMLARIIANSSLLLKSLLDFRQNFQ